MGQQVITLDTVIQRNDAKFIANSLGEEMVMMDMENGDFISLNKVGADIWKLSENRQTVRQLIDSLLTIYDITEDQCATETIQFLQDSLSQKMYVVYGPNGQPDAGVA